MLPKSLPTEDQVNVDRVFFFVTFRYPVFLTLCLETHLQQNPIWSLLECRFMARPLPHQAPVLILLLPKECDKTSQLDLTCTTGAQQADGRGPRNNQLSTGP